MIFSARFRKFLLKILFILMCGGVFAQADKQELSVTCGQEVLGQDHRGDVFPSWVMRSVSYGDVLLVTPNGEIQNAKELFELYGRSDLVNIAWNLEKRVSEEIIRNNGLEDKIQDCEKANEILQSALQKTQKQRNYAIAITATTLCVVGIVMGFSHVVSPP